MASEFPTATVDIPGHGTFSAPAMVVDWMIARHLPASPAQLRAIVEERCGLDYGDVFDVTAFLVMLADWEWASMENARDDDHGQRNFAR